MNLRRTTWFFFSWDNLVTKGEIVWQLVIKNNCYTLSFCSFKGGKNMKERIEKKLEENIERILSKEELLPTDVAILKEKLADIKSEENKEIDEEQRKEIMSLLMNGGFGSAK